MREAVFENVRRDGWHGYRVFGGPTPGWTYTIGFSQTFLTPELVLAGTTFFMDDELEAGFLHIVQEVRRGRLVAASDCWEVPSLGSVEFQPVDRTWYQHMLLGAVDYYSSDVFEALQIVPAVTRRMRDVPDLRVPYDPEREPPWRWFVEDWPYDLPPELGVFTDLEALRGTSVWSVVCDDEGDWTALASRELPPSTENLRIAPFGTLLALDRTLEEVLHLQPDQAAERSDAVSPWRFETA